MGDNKYIHFKIDCRSNKVFVSFLKKKSEVPKNGIAFLNKLEKERKGLPKYIWLDGNTENKKFRELMNKIYSTIEFEFTVTDTPQQNGKIKKIIALIWSRVRVMFDRSGINGELKKKL